MNSLLCLCFILFCISNVICGTLNAEDLCLKKHKSGNEFDMKNALGEWYPVYYWPPLVSGQQENCSKATFKQVVASDIKDCKVEIPPNETIYEMKYTNDKSEVVRYLYGAGDAKTLVDCKTDSTKLKVVHSDLGNGKLLAAICPTGSAVLLSKNLISASELEPTVAGVEVMKGIHGASECKLP